MASRFSHWMNGDDASDEIGLRLQGDGATESFSTAGTTDFFVDPADGRTVANGAFHYREVSGDVSLTAAVTPSFSATYDAGALLAWIDDTHWAKLAFEFTDMGFPAVVSVVTREYSDDANGQRIDEPSVRLRLSRRGSLWALHWQPATQDRPWYMLRYFRMGASTDTVRLGLLVQSPTGTGCRATFTDIAVGDAPEDMRAG